MKLIKILVLSLFGVLFFNSFGYTGQVQVKISGKGAVNDSTIKAGEPVSMDIYIENDSLFTGFSLGFALTSPDIKKVIHVSDKGNGLNKNGDVKGYNGWQDKSIWNYGGVFVVERDWDGKLPELLGFGGLCIQREYKPHKLQKCLSFDLIIPTPGTITVDSSFYPPGGTWLFAAPKPGATQTPQWGGPYTYKVIK